MAKGQGKGKGTSKKKETAAAAQIADAPELTQNIVPATEPIKETKKDKAQKLETAVPKGICFICEETKTVQQIMTVAGMQNVCTDCTGGLIKSRGKHSRIESFIAEQQEKNRKQGGKK